MALREDTGAPIEADPGQRSLHDGRTRDATVMVSGLLDGAVWQYSRDGIDWTSGGSNRTIDASVFGGNDGRKTIYVRQIDAAGTASAIQSLSFDYDHTRPAVAALTLLDGDGSPSADRRTNNAGLAVDAEAGSFWSYFFDTGHNGQGEGAGSTDARLTVPDGLRTLTVRQYDGAGNWTESTTSFWLDRTRPDAPMVQLVNDTGASASDGRTQDGSLAISGIEGSASWRYSIGGGAWITGTEAGPSVTLPSTALGDDGRKVVQVIQTDLAGNDSAVRTFSFELDRAAAAPTLSLKNDTGAVGDFISADPTIAIGGLEPGARWQWRTQPYEDWRDGSGSTLDSATTAGRSDLHVRQIDAAGNVSASSLLNTWVAPAGTEPTAPRLAGSGEFALLTGTANADTFVWSPKTVTHTGFDRVLNYRFDQGDALDLSAVLAGRGDTPLADLLIKRFDNALQTVTLQVRGETFIEYEIQLWNTQLSDSILVRSGSQFVVL